MGVISTTMKLKIQLVAVPSAAPLFLIARPLISVGCSKSQHRYRDQDIPATYVKPRHSLETNTEEHIVQLWNGQHVLFSMKWRGGDVTLDMRRPMDTGPATS